MLNERMTIRQQTSVIDVHTNKEKKERLMKQKPATELINGVDTGRLFETVESIRKSQMSQLQTCAAQIGDFKCYAV